MLMLPGICCIYFSNSFLISLRAPITTGIVMAFIPHILSISISRSSYFDSGDGHINKQAAFFLFVLDYNVLSVSLYFAVINYYYYYYKSIQ